jgi:uncharacterized protein
MANRLINEQSPYLLQHAHNPVDWYPWGDEAFERAKREHKPLIVSIGYAACHWCHVMEHESFEDDVTAAYMNAHFVCIKVDREEHPDVDHMYMDAVQAIGGSGGWPLNVFVTPERAPFYGGTYYPPRPAYNRPSWMQLMQRMTEIWEKQQDEVATQAEQMINYLQQASQKMSLTPALSKGEGDVSPARITENLLKMADKEKGGFGNAPKFPGTMAISYLLEYYHYNSDEAALQQALRSLDAMSEGGIYDQLGGGFARYATDRDWLIPHFEKMLYDNALLVIALCDAYSITKAERYKNTVDETIQFVENELKDKTGGYYCALDADSEGEEGKFYTWKWDEWIEALNENDVVAENYFGVLRQGNWEGTNILHVSQSVETLAAANNLTVAEVQQRINTAKKKLLAARNKRVRPMTDDKSLLSWNALMNTALSKAGVALQDDKYTTRATEHMEWMLKEFSDGDTLKHAWKNGVAKISAKLDDYAYLIQALMQLASATGENKWILRADDLMDVVTDQFSQDDLYFYYTSSGQADIPVRKVDLYDGATPSANAVMAHNLWLCGMCMEESRWVERAGRMITQMSDTTMRYSYSFGYWATLLQRHLKGMKTIVCTGNDAAYGRQIQSNYLPEAFLVTSRKKISELPLLEKKYFEGKMSIFVCTEQACLSPVNSVEDALRLIKK